jgi:hypothetical protein
MNCLKKNGLLTTSRLIATILMICLSTVVDAEVTTVAVLTAATNTPGGIAVDADGNVFSADFGGSNLFKIEPDGSISIFASGFLTPSGNGFDAQGDLYQSNYADQNNQPAPDTIDKITPDGTKTTFASGLNGPVGIAINSSGVLFVAMCNAQNVTRIGKDGVATTFATSVGFACPNGITFDTKGNLYTCNFNDGGVHKITKDGTVSLLATLPGGGNGHLAYVAGWLYVGDRVGNQIYRVHVKTGVSELVAGTGNVGSQMDGPDLQAEISQPNAVERNLEGSALFINGGGNRIRKLTLALPRPKKPTGVKVAALSGTRVRVKWKHGSLNREGFLVEARNGSSKFEEVAVVGVNKRKTVVKNLDPSTEYIFRVSAFNGVRMGKPSKKVAATTN